MAVVIIAFLLVALVALTVSHVVEDIRNQKVFEEYRRLREEADLGVFRERRKAQEILSGARDKSQEIIRDSMARAEEIVKQSKIFSEEEREKLISGLQRATGEHVEEFQKSLSRELVDEVKESQVEVRKRIDEEYEDVREEVERYRQERLDNVDEQIVELVRQVSRAVIKDSLEGKAQEESIVKALEEAKKKGVLGVSRPSGDESERKAETEASKDV